MLVYHSYHVSTSDLREPHQLLISVLVSGADTTGEQYLTKIMCMFYFRPSGPSGTRRSFGAEIPSVVRNEKLLNLRDCNCTFILMRWLSVFN